MKLPCLVHGPNVRIRCQLRRINQTLSVLCNLHLFQENSSHKQGSRRGERQEAWTKEQNQKTTHQRNSEQTGSKSNTPSSEVANQGSKQGQAPRNDSHGKSRAASANDNSARSLSTNQNQSKQSSTNQIQSKGQGSAIPTPKKPEDNWDDIDVCN